MFHSQLPQGDSREGGSMRGSIAAFAAAQSSTKPASRLAGRKHAAMAGRRRRGSGGAPICYQVKRQQDHIMCSHMQAAPRMYDLHSIIAMFTPRPGSKPGGCACQQQQHCMPPATSAQLSTLMTGYSGCQQRNIAGNCPACLPACSFSRERDDRMSLAPAAAQCSASASPMPCGIRRQEHMCACLQASCRTAQL